MIALAADDGRHAMKLVRERAIESGVRPDRVGMIGFSGGRHWHDGTPLRSGRNPPRLRRHRLRVRGTESNPEPFAPPLFLAVAEDDAMVENTLAMFTAYRNGKGAAELQGL